MLVLIRVLSVRGLQGLRVGGSGQCGTSGFRGPLKGLWHGWAGFGMKDHGSCKGSILQGLLR